MYGKIMFVVGAAVGYVVGTRQGREGYEKLKKQVTDLWENPKVQRTVADAQKFAEEKIPLVGAVRDAGESSGTRSPSQGSSSSAGSASGGSSGQGSTGSSAGSTGSTGSSSSPAAGNG
jgi:hypothetical protein